MNDVSTYNGNFSLSPPSSFKQSGNNDGSLNLEAHTSNNMKVKRPKITVNEITSLLPAQKAFSDKDATKRMQAINTDIYEGAKKEKEKHEFNFKRYFTILGIFALLATAIACFRRGK